MYYQIRQEFVLLLHQGIIVHIFYYPSQVRGRASSANRFDTIKYATARNIMSGILLTPGPVVNFSSMRSTRRVFLHSVNKSKFDNAGNKLKAANLGNFISVQYQNKMKLSVFLKKHPDEIREDLKSEENKDLCSIEEYSAKYFSPSPAGINDRLKRILVSLGLLSQDAFN